MAAVLELAGSDPKPLLRRASRREIGKQAEVVGAIPPWSPLEIASNSPIQYRFDNRSDRPVYFLLVGVDANGKAVMLYSSQPLLPKASLTLPATGNRPDRQSGLVQMQAIFATAPFSRIEEVLKGDNQFVLERQQQQPLLQPLNCATALLQDLQAASAVPSNILSGATDVFALDVRQWASFCFVYRVTEPSEN